MITQIEDYFLDGCGRCTRFATPDCSARKWHEGLTALRRICLSAGLTETVKWGHPCYTHGQRNIAIFGAFRADFRLTFFNAALLQDPNGLLKPQGPNSRHPNMISFTHPAEVAPLAPTLLAYLQEDMRHAEAGLKPETPPQAIPLPDELTEALDADPELAEAFHTLTPGRQKSYAINLNAAKTSATRITRITKFRDHILAGKGATER